MRLQLFEEVKDWLQDLEPVLIPAYFFSPGRVQRFRRKCVNVCRIRRGQSVASQKPA
jgi:hypothetical protein